MAGAGYKLFNSGDVLTAAQVNEYLQQQAVMVFASAAARTTALSGVLAEGMTSYLTDINDLQYYNGTSWVSFNYNNILDAKGDLISATAADTPAILTVGANNTILTADSTASTGLAWKGDWISYTPSWTASVTNPAIGNGTILGGYFRIGNWVTFYAQIQAGSTTTFGSGQYRVSLPVAANSSIWSFNIRCQLVDTGVSWYQNFYGTGSPSSLSSSFEAFNSTSNAVWNTTTPFTFGNGDVFLAQGSYRV
jgi:hypothetical protein